MEVAGLYSQRGVNEEDFYPFVLWRTFLRHVGLSSIDYSGVLRGSKCETYGSSQEMKVII